MFKKNKKLFIFLGLIILIIILVPSHSTPQTELIAQLDDNAVLDYNPNNQTIYYIESKRMNSDDGSQYIKALNLETNETIIIDQNFPYLSQPWIGAGKEGEIYVLDNGRNPYRNPLKETNQKSIIEYRNNEVFEVYSLEDISEQEDCEKYINSENVVTYLGLIKKENNNIYPQFLLHEEDEKIFYQTLHCDKELFNKDLDYYIDNNLQIINKDTFTETSNQDEYIWRNKSNDFKFMEKEPFYKMFGNSPCERAFDQIELGRSKYNMGSCIFSIHEFPSSGEFFDKEGNLIYAAQRGIYLLKK